MKSKKWRNVSIFHKKILSIFLFDCLENKIAKQRNKKKTQHRKKEKRKRVFLVSTKEKQFPLPLFMIFFFFFEGLNQWAYAVKFVLIFHPLWNCLHLWLIMKFH